MVSGVTYLAIKGASANGLTPRSNIHRVRSGSRSGLTLLWSNIHTFEVKSYKYLASTSNICEEHQSTSEPRLTEEAAGLLRGSLDNDRTLNTPFGWTLLCSSKRHNSTLIPAAFSSYNSAGLELLRSLHLFPSLFIHQSLVSASCECHDINNPGTKTRHAFRGDNGYNELKSNLHRDIVQCYRYYICWSDCWLDEKMQCVYLKQTSQRLLCCWSAASEVWGWVARLGEEVGSNKY